MFTGKTRCKNGSHLSSDIFNSFLQNSNFVPAPEHSSFQKVMSVPPDGSDGDQVQHMKLIRFPWQRSEVYRWFLLGCYPCVAPALESIPGYQGTCFCHLPAMQHSRVLKKHFNESVFKGVDLGGFSAFLLIPFSGSLWSVLFYLFSFLPFSVIFFFARFFFRFNCVVYFFCLLV